MAHESCSHPPGRHAHGKEDLRTFTRRLHEDSRRVTQRRTAILEVLQHHGRPLTNKEIHAALPRGTCDLATVYRSMHLLESMRLVQRFDFGDGAARWELVAPGTSGHHHHLICRRCNEVVELDECPPPEWQQRLAAQHGFIEVEHRLELFGICPACQK